MARGANKIFGILLPKVRVGREITVASANLAESDVDTIVQANYPDSMALTILEGSMRKDDITYVLQIGAGQVTIVAETPANQSINSACRTGAQNEMIAIICLDDTSGAEVYKVIGGVE